MHITTKRPMISRAMQQHDDFVIVFDYRDSRGTLSRRVVSPIRFIGKDRFLGLCLTKEEPRQFCEERCSNIRLALAADFVMPVALTC